MDTVILYLHSVCIYIYICIYHIYIYICINIHIIITYLKITYHMRSRVGPAMPDCEMQVIFVRNKRDVAYKT